ncbi:DUF3397 domain-containing protein [Salipaludibacillus sp. CF4.18]|uniref:DUF3397 domain-containing protein n=1 Tax=Salipaludibacillus sp. CF4.18 TaxID=3373081 RepID=UPI003EE5C60A
MGDLAIGFIATLITAPILGLYLVYFVLVKITKSKQYAFKTAVDYTVFLFIMSVYFLCREIWSLEIGSFVLLFLLLSATIFTIVHWKHNDDIQIKKVFKSVWRFQFVVYLPLYFIFTIYGLVFRIFS